MQIVYAIRGVLSSSSGPGDPNTGTNYPVSYIFLTQDALCRLLVEGADQHHRPSQISQLRRNCPLTRLRASVNATTILPITAPGSKAMNGTTQLSLILRSFPKW